MIAIARCYGFNKTHFQALSIQCPEQAQADGCQATFHAGWGNNNINHESPAGKYPEQSLILHRWRPP